MLYVDGFGVVVVCVRDMFNDDCACGMCGKHLYMMMRVCELACIR